MENNEDYNKICFGEDANFVISCIQLLREFGLVENLFDGWASFGQSFGELEEDGDEEVYNGKLLDKRFAEYYKIYIWVSRELALREFRKILELLSKIMGKTIKGKIALTSKMYTESSTPRIVIYVFSERTKNKILKGLDKINWDNRSIVKNIKPRYKKVVSPRVAWNQGGDGIRESAAYRKSLDKYFEGENFHLIKKDVIDMKINKPTLQNLWGLLK